MSKGKTSWSGRSELGDYISFVGFFISYLNDLQPSSSGSTSEPSLSFTSSLSPVPSALLTPDYPVDNIGGMSSGMVLLLGGYSYGSMITMHLPSTETLLSRFSDVVKGTAEAEIRLRAMHLSTQWNADCRKARRGSRSLTVEDGLHSSSHSVIMGGDESEPGTRRLSRESRHSLDAVLRSVDRSRAKLWRRTKSTEFTDTVSHSDEKMASTRMPRLRTSYLLVSPLLPPISMFATMFTKLDMRCLGRSSHLPESEEKLVSNPTLAVFGDKDFFTSHKKLQSWAEGLHGASKSRFQFRAVTSAGHFWHEEGAEREMCGAVGDWIDGIIANEEIGAESG